MSVKIFLVVVLSCLSFHFCIAQEEDEYVFKNKSHPKKKSISNKSIYDVPNPDYTSYFLSPTAFTLPKRKIRLANNSLFFIKGTYGLTNTTNVSVTTTLFGSMIGSIKQSINLDDEKTLSFSASFGDFTASLKDTNILFTGADANFTFGNHQNNITIGTGVYFFSSNIELVNYKKQFFAHAITFGLQNQISRKMYIMIDGYYFTNYSVLTAAAGLKFVIGKRFTLNAGIMPILWNDTRSSRYDIKPFLMPVVSFRTLLGRF